MDKFGIFNLLNSFFSANGQKNQDSPNQSANTDNLLSSLFSSLNNQKKPENNAIKPIPTINVSPPLQQSMLSTMKNHDNFVKRVKSQVKT